MEQESRKPVKRALARTAIALVLLGVAGLSFYKMQVNKDEAHTVKVVPPTCTDSGYALYTNKRTGTTEVADVTPALGHQYGQWNIVREADGVNPAMDVRICEVCGEEDTQARYAELGIARLTLNGSFEGIGKKDEVPLTAELVTGDLHLTTYATAKYQGHSTLAFDKKNYTVKFYEDEERSEKMKLTLSHWNPENKYILKANYQDPSQSRNLVTADIWAEMVASRENVPAEFEGLSNYGAVDGFPVALYENDAFRGLYTMNIHKDDDLFGMKDSEEHAIMIVNDAKREEAYFRSETEFMDASSWEVEFCGTEDETWAKERLNSFIRFVQTADDKTFRAQLGSYLDVESAIDYLIAMYSLGLQEHGAKDLVLVTYGPEEPWICSMYDMEEAFDTDGAYPSRKNSRWNSGTGSLLWDRVLNGYFDEICERYAQLRQNVLQPDTLAEKIENYVNQIPWYLYEEDSMIHNTETFTEEKLEEILGNIRELIEKTDELFLG